MEGLNLNMLKLYLNGTPFKTYTGELMIISKATIRDANSTMHTNLSSHLFYHSQLLVIIQWKDMS